MFSRKWIMLAVGVLLVALPVSVAFAKKGSKGKSVVVSGTVKSVDTAKNLVTVTVSSDKGGSNNAGQGYAGQDVEFDVTDAKLQVGDANGDGDEDLEDVTVGDDAQVQAKVKSTDAQPFKAKRFKDRTTLQDEGDDDDSNTTTS